MGSAGRSRGEEVWGDAASSFLLLSRTVNSCNGLLLSFCSLNLIVSACKPSVTSALPDTVVSFKKNGISKLVQTHYCRKYSHRHVSGRCNTYLHLVIFAWGSTFKEPLKVSSQCSELMLSYVVYT